MITAKKWVDEHIDELVGKSAKELLDVAKEAGFWSKTKFPAFKRALLKHGIDYDSERDSAYREKLLEKKNVLKEKCKYQVEFFVGASWTRQRFAITLEKEPIWFGRFFEKVYSQAEADTETVRKAIWLANKVAESLGEEAIRLVLTTNAGWVYWANDEDGRGGKAHQLFLSALHKGVFLEVRHISKEENPVHKWIAEKGYKKWSDNDLSSLAEQLAGGP